MTRGDRDCNYPSHMHFLPTMQLWEPLIFGDLPGPSAGQLLALHLADFFFFFFFFSEALLFLRDTALSRFLDFAPGTTSRGVVPDYRVLSRVSNHSLGQLATNTIPVRHFFRKIFALLGYQRICSGWLVCLHGRLVLI